MSNSVNAAGAVADYTYVGKGSDTGNVKISTETFLKLLVAQLQYQDPLEPQSNTELVAELAQMSQIEQSQMTNQHLSAAKAYDLIGKYVYAEVLNDLTGVTEQYYGRVESIVTNKGTSYAVMGGYAVNIGNITQVFESNVISDTQPAENAD